MKKEALKLADDLEELHEQDLIDGVAHLSMPQASAMIRRLVEELDKKDQLIESVKIGILTRAVIEERQGIK